MTDVIPMFDELPVYQEDLDRIKAKKPKVNCLQDVVLELMNERGLRDTDIVKATGIPWPTWQGWIAGDVNTQLVDKNLFSLWRFLKAPLEYLCFGVGDDTLTTDAELMEKMGDLRRRIWDLEKEIQELKKLNDKTA